MYNFHYNVMKPNFGDKLHLLYMDMDSFIHKISSDDVYEELRLTQEIILIFPIIQKSMC